MTFHIVGRRIMQNGSLIGAQGDQEVETIRFIMPRKYGEIDLAAGEATVVFQNQAGQTGAAILSSMASGEQLVLPWTVGCEAANVPGKLEARLVIIGNDNMWRFSTEVTIFNVARGLTGQGDVLVSSEMRTALIELLESRGALVTGGAFSQNDYAVILTRYDGSQITVPIPEPDIIAEIL